MEPTEKQRTRLTVAMIVVDAEKSVDASLESVFAIADEIIVAHTGSGEQIRAVGASRATRLLEIPWQNDFSAVRNTCLESTTGDWILWLDAGETLSERAAGELRRFVDEAADPQKAYRLLVRVTAAQGAFAALQIAQYRLIPRHPGLHFCGCIRESPEMAIAACSLQSETLDLVITRSDGGHHAKSKLQKARRNLRICEEKLPQLPTDVQMLLARGEALAELGEREQARTSFRQARKYAADGSIEMLESYYGELASCDCEPSLREQQLNLCIEALKTFPVDMQLLCAMGNYLQQQQRIDLASRAYQTAAQHGQIHHTTWHLVDIADIATTCLSVTLELQDQQNEARVILENALLERPRSCRMRHQLIDLHIRQGKRKEAIEQVARLPVEWPQRDAFANAVRGACLAGEKNWAGAEAYLQTAFDAGCRDVLCLRWLTLTHAALEHFDIAQEILDQWQISEPNSPEISKISASLLTRKFNQSASQLPAAPSDAIPSHFQVHRGTHTDGSPPEPKSKRADAAPSPVDRSGTI
jgi:tetratricopeptide (TPR) repeat protein